MTDDTALAETARSDGAGTAGSSGRGLLAAGAKLGRYEILAFIGAGGMGSVYRARDPELGRQVAVKLLDTSALDGDEAHQRLRREAQAMARVEHPAVVRVYDVGVAGERMYVTMELVSGGTLATWVKDRSAREILRAYAIAGRGLGAAHAAGLVHRDFKPANVLVDGHGHPRVTDFGLARSAGEGEQAAHLRRSAPVLDMTLTTPGDIVGTPMYMAPEQLAGEAVDARADQFAFCLSLWEALYGQRAFQIKVGGIAALEALQQTIERGEIVTPPRRRGVSRRVELALRRGLSASPAARWPSVEVLVDELQPRSRRRWLALGAGTAVAAAAVGVAVWLHGGGASARAPATLVPGRFEVLEQAQVRDDASFVLLTAFRDGRLVRTSSGHVTVQTTPGGASRELELPEPGPSSVQAIGADHVQVAITHGDGCSWWLVPLAGKAEQLLPLTAPCVPLEVSPDLTQLAVAGEKAVKIRDRRSGAERVLATGLGSLEGVSWSPDGTTLAVMANGSAHFFRAATGEPTGPTLGAAQFGWADSSHVVYTSLAVGSHGTIRMLSIADGSDTLVEEVPAMIADVELFDGGLLVMQQDSTSHTYVVPATGTTPEVDALKPLATDSTKDSYVVAWTPAGIVTMSLVRGKRVFSRTAVGGATTVLATSDADGTGLMASTDDLAFYMDTRSGDPPACDVRVLELASGRTRSWRAARCGAELGLATIACASAAQRCIASDANGTARWLDARTLELGSAAPHALSPGTELSPDATELASTDGHGIAIGPVVGDDATPLVPAPELPGDIVTLRWARDGKHLLVSTFDADGTSHVLALERTGAWHEIATSRAHTMPSFSESPDGASLAVILWSGQNTWVHQTFTIR